MAAANPDPVEHVDDPAETESDDVREHFLQELDRQAKALGRVPFLLQSLSPDSEDEDEDEISEAEGGSLEYLRTKKLAFLSESCMQELKRIQERLEQEGYPNGYHWQIAAAHDPMYKVFASELQRADGNFDILLALTLAFKEEVGMHCFTDTERPAEARKLLTHLGKLWQTTLREGMPLDERSREGVMFALQKFRANLKDIHYQYAYQFKYEPSQPQATFAKKRKQLSGKTMPLHDYRPGKRDGKRSRREPSATPEKKRRKLLKKKPDTPSVGTHPEKKLRGPPGKNPGMPSVASASLFANSALMERVKAKLDNSA